MSFAWFPWILCVQVSMILFDWLLTEFIEAFSRAQQCLASLQPVHVRVVLESPDHLHGSSWWCFKTCKIYGVFNSSHIITSVGSCALQPIGS